MPVLLSVTLSSQVPLLVNSDGDKPCIQTGATMPEKKFAFMEFVQRVA